MVPTSQICTTTNSQIIINNYNLKTQYPNVIRIVTRSDTSESSRDFLTYTHLRKLVRKLMIYY